MKLVLVGGSGRVGSHVVREALARGHEVRTVSRADADVFDPLALAPLLRGHDAVVSAYGAPADAPQLLVGFTQSLVAAARAAGVDRVVTVGGAGGLAVAPGRRLADTPGFPAALLPKVKAHEDAVVVLAGSGLSWTCLSPAAQIVAGAGSGGYRLAVGSLVANAQGGSSITYPDFARALLDELEAGRHLRQLVGVGD